MRYMGPMFYENWLNDNDLDANGNCISTDIVYAQVLVSILYLWLVNHLTNQIKRTSKSKLRIEMFDFGILEEIQSFAIFHQESTL